MPSVVLLHDIGILSRNRVHADTVDRHQRLVTPISFLPQVTGPNTSNTDNDSSDGAPDWA